MSVPFFLLERYDMNAQRSLLLWQSIESEQRKLEEAMKACVLGPCADDNEMASCYESAHANISLLKHVQKRLSYLKQRMTVLENRPHTLCMECGEAISARRLAAIPDALRCAACQTEWEEAQKHSLSWDETGNSFLLSAGNEL